MVGNRRGHQLQLMEVINFDDPDGFHLKLGNFKRAVNKLRFLERSRVLFNKSIVKDISMRLISSSV